MSSNEGLEAGEILDDLDLEVQTATTVGSIQKLPGAGIPKEILDENGQRTKVSYTTPKAMYEVLNRGDELVTRKKMEEGLVEAVQHGRKQERRRIFEIIDEEQGNYALKSDAWNALEKVYQGLEEEVEGFEEP